jgi:sarcosine oxidase, subunit gamma
MSDHLARQGVPATHTGATPVPLNVGATQAGPNPVPSTGFHALPRLARFSLRGELSALAAALGPASAPISQSVCRSVEADGCTALWLGPDEQLLLAPEAQGPHLEQLLTQRLANVPHSLVDISQRQLAFAVAGEHARTLLAVGCPLDLRDEVFPVGMCTRTIFDKCEMVLWRPDVASFHVEVARSFAPHVIALFEQATRELGS